MFWYPHLIGVGGRGLRQRKNAVWGKKRNKQGRDRERHKEKKTPAQLVCTEDLSHDLNILGDKICPHCRNSFLSKTCSFSSARGMHQCSIVSVCCDHIVLPHGCKVQSNNTFALQHNSKGTQKTTAETSYILYVTVSFRVCIFVQSLAVTINELKRFSGLTFRCIAFIMIPLHWNQNTVH